MSKTVRGLIVVHIFFGLSASLAHSSVIRCSDAFNSSRSNIETDSTPIPTGSAPSRFFNSVTQTLKAKRADMALTIMAYSEGLPARLKRIKHLEQTGQYLAYKNFGAMGLAETGVPVRYNQKRFHSLNTKRQLVIIANHPLGIADAWSLLYIAGRARGDSETLLFLARWVEKLFPPAIYGDPHGWGSGLLVDIDKPLLTDPQYSTKIADFNYFNMKWARSGIRVLRLGGAVIIFPAGHISTINKDGSSYPKNVYDAPDSWMTGILDIARMGGNADIVFAHVDSVNSEEFYNNRRRYGGGDKERVIWLLKETQAKASQSVDVQFSDPMSLNDLYETLALRFGLSRKQLEADPKLTVELMRQYTYKVPEYFPQILDTTDLSQKMKIP